MNRMNKKVLLLAYTNLNFGDDMFIKTICMTYPNINFVLEAPENYKDVMSTVGNLEIVSKNKLYNFLDKVNHLFLKIFPLKVGPIRRIWLNKYIAIVYVIGGLFDDDDLWQDYVAKYGLMKYKNAILRNSLTRNIPFYLLGCNMTRIRSKEYVSAMKYIFDGIEDVCFRDKYSYDNFELSNTRYAPDLVFNYPVKYNKGIQKQRNVIISIWGVLLHCDIMPQWKWAENKWDAYKRFIIDIIHYFSQNQYSIVLLSLCENEGDKDACGIIMEESGVDDLTILNYVGNMDDVISAIEKASFVVGTRFHSVVLSLSSKTLIYPIVYESKTMQLLKDCGYSGEFSNIENIGENEVEKVISSFESGYCCEGIDEIKEEAKQQFLELNKLLIKEGETRNA